MTFTDRLEFSARRRARTALTRGVRHLARLATLPIRVCELCSFEVPASMKRCDCCDEQPADAGAAAVALLDHPDLVVARAVPVDEYEDERDNDIHNSEASVAARTTFSWVVRFDVCGTWVADGFDLTNDRALNMLAHDLDHADIGTELEATVIAAPPADRIAQTQGYRDAADRDAQERR